MESAMMEAVSMKACFKSATAICWSATAATDKRCWCIRRTPAVFKSEIKFASAITGS